MFNEWAYTPGFNFVVVKVKRGSGRVAVAQQRTLPTPAKSGPGPGRLLTRCRRWAKLSQL